MSATDHPEHPANSGRGSSEAECQSFRTVHAPLTIIPDEGSLIEPHEFKVDCVLDPDHFSPHEDVAGRRWESVA